MMSTLQVGIYGAAGRMGRRLIALGTADPALTIAAAVDSPECPQIGEDAGEIAGIKKIGVLLSGELDRQVDVVIDFSNPKGLKPLLKYCVDRKIPLVYATTGLNGEEEAELYKTSESIPLLYSPSMSMSVILAMKLSQYAAKVLKDKDADVEIIEHHHRYKADAPSGTALKFGQLIAQEMGIGRSVHGREGKCGARPHHEIGYHAVRIGDQPGSHTILFGMLGETLEITVKASNRDCYALGALEAAKFLIGKPTGLYNMNDVLGL